MRPLPCLAALLILPATLAAQPPHPQVPQPSRKIGGPKAVHRLQYLNRATCYPLNVVALGPYAGISYGLSYERFLKDGLVSFSAGARMLNGLAITNDFGVPGFGQLGRDFRGACVSASGLYHPLGNRRRFDLSTGAALLAGRVRMREQASAGVTSPQSTEHTLSAIAGQLGLNLNGGSILAFGIQLRGGPVLSTGFGGAFIAEAGVQVGMQL